MEGNIVKLTHNGEGHTYSFRIPLQTLVRKGSREVECPICMKKYMATKNGISPIYQ